MDRFYVYVFLNRRGLGFVNFLICGGTKLTETQNWKKNQNRLRSLTQEEEESPYYKINIILYILYYNIIKLYIKLHLEPTSQ
jgi:hypothetical protein